MTDVVTVSERKRREAARRRVAASEVMAELGTFGAHRDGRFIVFGSAALNRMSFDSDFDVVVDFPSSVENAAVEFVESLCRARHLPADIHLKSLASERFEARIADHAVVIP